MREENEQQVADVIEHYRSGFATLDSECLRSIWDKDYDGLIYVASERAHPIRDWRGIAQYYDSYVEVTESVSVMEIADLALDVIGDTAYAFCGCHFEGVHTGQPQGMVSDIRVTFILRRVSEAWKVIHFHESSLGKL